MQEIREFGKTFKWCAKGADIAAGYVGSDVNSVNCLVDSASAGSQSYYAESAVIADFKAACEKDAGLYDYGTGFYALGGDTLLPVLVAKIKALDNSSSSPSDSEYLGVDVALAEKTTRRLLVYLQKRVPTGELGGYREVNRFLYLVPEVAKWCP
jgi:hypothetical protein